MARAVIQSIVSEMIENFLGEGLADRGVYTPPGGSPVDCRIFIVRGRAPGGTFGSVAKSTNSIKILLSEIPQPVRDATVDADGSTFRLVKMIKETDALSEWEVGS
jgi:hypothetical protein